MTAAIETLIRFDEAITKAPAGEELRPWRDATVVAVIAHARSVPSLAREAFASAIGELPSSPAWIVVHTCHRVELYIAPDALAGDPFALASIPSGAAILTDADAVRHLISVACGVDSAVFGETQILHQLRETFAARSGGSVVGLDPVLDRLFTAALHGGRIAHGWFNGSPRSLADVALDRIEHHAGPLEGRRILVVGVGRMGRLAALAARRRNASLVITNRGAERADALARELGATTIPFGVDGGIDHLEGVILAIGGTWSLGGRDRRRLIELGVPVVDISSPPAVPAEVRAELGERFVSVDDLVDEDAGPSDRLRGRLDRLISDTGRDYCAWVRSRSSVPAIKAVIATVEQRRLAEVEWLRRHLAGLSAEDQAVVEQMSHRLVAAILHAPLTALQGDTSGDLEHAARELFGV